MFNLQLAVDVLTVIEEALEDPAGGEWKQSEWGQLDSLLARGSNSDLITQDDGTIVGVGSCGTAKCFAGWALSLAKVPMVWERMGGTQTFVANFTADGENISERAAEILGIHGEWEDFPDLFNANNDLDDLYRITAEYAQIPESELRGLVTARLLAAQEMHEKTTSSRLDTGPGPSPTNQEADLTQAK